MMEIGSVSTVSMIGMVVSLIISVGLPIALCVFLRVKKRASLSSVLTGCAVFILFALTLEQLLHTLVFQLAGEALMNNILLYALYGACAAALFEETGRFLAMKHFMKNQLDRKNALMYGVGHGGAEAIILIGMSYLNNIATAVMINNGQIRQVLEAMPAEQKDITYQNISLLWTTPGYQFFMSGVERILAIALQIALSVLVYKAVKRGQNQFFFLAMGAHFITDFVAVIATRFIPVIAVEGLLFVMTALVAYLAYRVYKEDEACDDACTD